MYERITMTWWDRFFGRSRILDHYEYMELSERKKRKFRKCAPVPDQHIRPASTFYDYPTSSPSPSNSYRSESERSTRRDEYYTPPIMPDYGSFSSGSSYDSGSSSSSDSGSSFDFGGGDGGGGGASSDY